MIYDAHIHKKNKENGGFVVGLEGNPYFEGTFSNMQALEEHDIDAKYIAFYYITYEECNSGEIEWKYIKYHPRREQYTPDEVIKSIKINKPRAVMIDTLNEPFWQAYDYWKIAKIFPDIIFIFAHAGGYLLNEFLKICHFQPNVWIDFALTHSTLGRLGDENGLIYISQGINYALHSAFKERVLLASDYPFFDQEAVFNYYKEYIDLLNNNFERLIDLIG